MDSVSIVHAGCLLKGKATSRSYLPTGVTASRNKSHVCNLPPITLLRTTHDTGMFRKMLP